jgi:hypothetical protein
LIGNTRIKVRVAVEAGINPIIENAKSGRIAENLNTGRICSTENETALSRITLNFVVFRASVVTITCNFEAVVAGTVSGSGSTACRDRCRNIAWRRA